jgi:hypothetical protein
MAPNNPEEAWKRHMRQPTHEPRPTLVLLLLMSALATAQERSPYRAHDSARPRPAVISPGSGSLPPSDAIVLFDGKDLSNWQSPDGSAPKWKLENGRMHPTPNSGPLQTKESFGDVQLHLEWSAPTQGKGKSQGKGNSGVYLMTKYEVQILDSYENETYADGQAGAIYGQSPPMVNASRPPGEWQTFEIIFRRPRFTDDGSLKQPSIMTVLHNGVLVQDHFHLWGPTNWLKFDAYEQHTDALPISLQDHGDPVGFRNIWLRKLPALPTYTGLGEEIANVTLSDAQLDRYTGDYLVGERTAYEVTKHGGALQLSHWGRKFDLVPKSETKFLFKRTDADVEFELDDDGIARKITVTITGAAGHATKR